MTDVLNWRCEGQLQAKERPHEKAKLLISWSWIYSSSNWEMFLLFKPPWQSMMFYYGSPNWMISCLCSLFGAFLVMYITMWFSSFSVKIFSFFLPLWRGFPGLTGDGILSGLALRTSVGLVVLDLTESGKHLVVSQQSGKKRPWVIFKSLPFRTSLVVQWLRLHASSAGGMGLIPVRETSACHVVWQKKSALFQPSALFKF